MRRINASRGINGRPVKLIVEDYESRIDTGLRKAEKLATQWPDKEVPLGR